MVRQNLDYVKIPIHIHVGFLVFILFLDQLDYFFGKTLNIRCGGRSGFKVVKVIDRA